MKIKIITVINKILKNNIKIMNHLIQWYQKYQV
jgi:hypothetical protein